MRLYSRRQTEDSRIEQARRSEAYRKIPELSALDREVSEDAVRRVRASLQGDAPSSAPPSSLSYDERRRSLLTAHGYPAGYLDPVFSCPDCHDTGYIGTVPCHCFRQAAIDLFYTQSGLRDVLERENFDTFSPDWYPEDLTDPVSGMSSRKIMEDIHRQCLDFAEHYDALASPFLLMTGNPGLGKTFLSHCIAKKLMDSGHSVIYYSAAELFGHLADIQFRQRQDVSGEEEAFDAGYLTSCDLLIIDDLGTEMANSFTASSLFRLLNTRCAARRGLIISTNLTLGELSSVYSERIASRLAGTFTLLQFFGQDVRVQKRLSLFTPSVFQ